MRLSDVVDKLLNEHSLADTSTTEETNLATTSVGSEEIDDLDTSLKNFSGRGLLDEWRGFGMDGEPLDALDRATLVDGLANDIHDTAEGGFADRNLDGGTGVNDLLTTNKTLGTIHSNCADAVFAKVRGNFEDETTTAEVLDLEGVKNRREVVRVELDIYDGTNDGFDVTNWKLRFGRVEPCWKKMSTINSEQRV